MELIIQNNIISAIGVGLVLIGLYRFWIYFRLKKNGVSTDGEIYEIEEKFEEDGKTFWLLIRYYTSPFGYITKRTDFPLRSFSKYNRGDKVPVVYLPDNPELFMIDDRSDLKLIAAFIISGIMLMIIGLLVSLSAVN